MNIRQKIFIPMIVSVILLSLIGYIVINSQLSALKGNNFNKIINDKINQINSAIVFGGKMQLEKAALFSKLPIVLKAFQLAHSGNIDDPKNPKAQQARELLRRQLNDHASGFKSLEHTGKLKLHFHLPNGRSLLRMWRDKQTRVDGKWVDISDDISGFRQTVLDVNQLGQSKSGIELGRGGFVIRGVTMVKDSENKILGSVELLMDFKPVMNNAIVENNKQTENLFLYMNADLLPITKRMHDPTKYPVLNKQFVFVYGTGDQSGKSYIHLAHLHKGKKELFVDQQGEFTLGYFPIRDYRSRQIGVMVYAFDKQLCDAQIMQLNRIIFGIFLFILVVWGGINYLILSKYILSPIAYVRDFSKAVANGDVTARLAIQQGDEIGDMSQALNNMAEKQAAMLTEIRDSIEQLSGASTDLTDISANMIQRTDATVVKTKSMQTESEQMNKAMESVASSSEQASVNMKTIAATTDEMNSTVNEIARHAGEAKNITLTAVNQSEAASENVTKLGDVATSITQFADTITEISEQTNLLALNATIEAARAGEAGKGFTVVANEIKELAKGTSEATQEIKNQIGTIHQATNDSVEQIKNVSTIINNIDSAVSAIAAAIEEQVSATREISTNIAEASTGIQDVAAHASQTLKTTQSFTNETFEISRAGDDMKSNSQKVKDRADDLNRMSIELKKLMAQFTL
ncbi:MAG: methyl-accepting chemotaxis sensory transducer [Candidatus Magnetoglobus multicellularis str. Araruama]|uniref:Methyl-accepting chemotaxis sensory transducer n=1 Tax=Candidatus Magnetoglobus multicellularis str. Araruama TaxID=890399 RepID=A0A1V1PC55_9BACT|nr:MAG: methyl-accepting chemotaxis sensory transducer [Candidatus Magnetoglobus multicellularis str. Araruama]